MIDKTLDRRIAAARRRLEALGRLASNPPEPQRALLSEAMDELSAALEQLQQGGADGGRPRGEGRAVPRRTLDALEEERRRLFAVLDLLPAFIYLQGRDYSVHFANRRFRELFGDPGGRRCYQVLSGRQAPCEECPTFRVLENGTPQLWEWSSKAGRTYMVYNDRFPSPDGPEMVLNVGIDVTEHKRAEEALQWELAVSRALAELSNSLIVSSSSVEDIASIVLDCAKRLTNSAHGFVSSIDPQTRASVAHTLTAMMGKQCRVSGKNRIVAFPIGPDGRYPALWGHALNTREAFYTNSPGTHEASRGVPKGHVPLRNLLAVPAVAGQELVGEVALANSDSGYTERDLESVKRLTELYALAVQRQRKEEALVQSEQRLRKLAEISPVGIFRTDARGHCLFVNPKWCEIAGLTAEEALGEGWIRGLHPEDRDGVAGAWYEAARHNRPFAMEYRFAGRDGRTTWVFGQAAAEMSEAGDAVGYVGTITDITERKRAAEEIARLAKFPDENPNPVLRVSEDGAMLYANKAGLPVLAVWGCRQGEPLTGRWHQFVQEALRDGRSRQSELECGGRIFSLTFAPVVGSNYVNVYALDISKRKRAEQEVRKLNEKLEERVAERTAQLEAANQELKAEIAERRRAEEALRASETKYRDLVQNASSIILRADTRGNITFFNEFAQQFFGYREQEILGRNVVGTIVPATDRAGRDLAAMVNDIAQAREGYAANEKQNMRRNGDRVWIAWTNKAIRDARGRVVELLCIGNDITERKQLEQELLRVGEVERQHVGQDLHDSLGQTLSGTAYLSQVLHRKLAAKSLPEAADAAKIAGLLSESVALAKSLARGLCPIEPGPEGLMTALGELALRVESLFGISCIFECLRPVLVHDIGVAGHLYRIAQEATTNAVRHGRGGEVLVRLSSRGGLIELSVLDDGVGLPREWNGKEGMGLRIMRYRAHAIGASFEVRRRPEAGTAVTCRLPIRQDWTDGEVADRHDEAC